MIPEQRFENMDTSVRKYLADNWAITPIEWPDSQFPDAGNVNEWIQPTLMKGPRAFRRQVAPGKLGARLTLLFNVNVNLKCEFVETENPNRRIELVDLLFDLFKENSAVPFKDYVGNPTTPDLLGVIQCYDFADRSIGKDAGRGLYVHNCTSTMFVTEEREV